MKTPFALRILACVVCAFSLTDAHSQQTIIVPDVIGEAKNANLMVLTPYAPTPYSGQEKDIQELYDLLVFDLQFSDAFEVFRETPEANALSRQDDAAAAVNYAEWARLSVADRTMDFVCKTIIKPRGAGQIQVDVFVYDINSGARPVGQAYGAEPTPPITRSSFRRAGHKITADIVTNLTNGQVVPISETRIAFSNYVMSKKTKELYVIDYDGHPGSLTQITFYNSVSIMPDWSPSGADLAYVSFRNKWPDCFIQNVGSGSVLTLAKFKGSNNTPRWCPDGENLLGSFSGEGNPEIYRIHRSGRPFKRLTNNPASDVSPDMSSQGDLIAFTSDRWANTPQIFIMNSDGSNPHRISYIERKCDTPFWSPEPVPTATGDAYRIAFTGYFGSGQSDIFVMSPDGTDSANLTSGSGPISQNPTWAPNGRYVAFSSNMGGKPEIYITSAVQGRSLPNGQRFYQVTHLGGENVHPAWSPK